MSNYSIGSGGKLGSFELHGVSNTFGNQGFAGLGDFGTNGATDASAGDVLTGVGSILDSIAGPLASIYVSQQKAELERKRIKAGYRPSAGPSAEQMVALAQARAAEVERLKAAAKKGSGTAIIAIVVGVIVLGVMFMMMQKKD